MIEYREILGFIGYKIGSDGTIWSNRKMGRRIKESPDVIKTSNEWKKLNTPCLTNGYPSIALRKNGKVYTFLVHRLMMELFIGPCPENMEVCHNDGNKKNNRLNNLRYGTSKENKADQVKHGTRQCGIKNGHAILDDDKVKEIRQRYLSGEHYLNLANEFGVSRQTISAIIFNRTWCHLLSQKN